MQERSKELVGIKLIDHRIYRRKIVKNIYFSHFICQNTICYIRTIFNSKIWENTVFVNGVKLLMEKSQKTRAHR